MRPRWLIILLDYTPRGASLDSVKQRLRVARLILGSFARREYWPWGYGSRVGPKPSMEYGIIRWAAVHGVEKVPTGHSHVDLLHYLYEYGAPGMASVIMLGILVIPKLRFGDPWSACVVAGAILSGGTLMFRYPGTALVWLAAVVHVVTR